MRLVLVSVTLHGRRASAFVRTATGRVLPETFDRLFLDAFGRLPMRGETFTQS